MADSSKLENWLAANAVSLNLQATQLAWPQKWGIANLFDVEITIDVEGQLFVGRGTSENEDLAYLKAGAEAIERAICKSNKLPSVGVAVHTSEQQAKDSATAELLEREAFFNHFYSTTPFARLNEEDTAPVSAKWRPAFDKLLSRKITCAFYCATLTNRTVVMCVCEGLVSQPIFGGVIGLGIGDSLPAAVQASFLEAIRNVAFAIETNDVSKLSADEFLSIKNPTSLDRQKLARCESFWQTIKTDFLSNAGAPKQTPNVNETAIEIVELKPRFATLKTAPVICYRASFTPSDLIAPTAKSPATFSRLEQFLGHSITRAKIEKRPHFLG